MSATSDRPSGRPRGEGTPLRVRYGGALDGLAEVARAGEIVAGWLRAERREFVRFNRARVRQAGGVERATLELRLIRDGRQARHTLTLSGVAGEDRRRVAAGAERLRAVLAAAPPDPLLAFSDRPSHSVHLAMMRMPTVEAIADAVSSGARGADLVGFLASGPVACAMASSVGHRHWHEAAGWSFDWSVHVPGGAAALKAAAAGADASVTGLREAIERSVRDAAVLARPPIRLAPGSHRCHLAPRAVADLVEMLAWGGFSARARASGQSPLARLYAGESRFDPRVSIAEDLEAAGVPRFQADGWLRPGRLELVRSGRAENLLVSPRSAREFALQDNGAPGAEAPEALTLACGTLDPGRALERLGTGIAIPNLWYLNFSDRQHCRITGMTRHATLWVAGGEPVAPLAPMRFDDSLYRILGESLEALEAHAPRMPDTSTYEGRSFGATTAPGALVSALRFTL